MGLEPTTSSLGSWHSTIELRPLTSKPTRKHGTDARQDLLRKAQYVFLRKFGAGDGIRTRNPRLGKPMRYRYATPAHVVGTN